MFFVSQMVILMEMYHQVSKDTCPVELTRCPHIGFSGWLKCEKDLTWIQKMALNLRSTTSSETTTIIQPHQDLKPIPSRSLARLRSYFPLLCSHSMAHHLQ